MSIPTPSNPSLRSHIADVLAMSLGGVGPPHAEDYEIADALLADPTLAAIIDLAAWSDRGWHTWDLPMQEQGKAIAVKKPPLAPEVRALLANWRAKR